jgi:hypothetical protein
MSSQPEKFETAPGVICALYCGDASLDVEAHRAEAPEEILDEAAE